MLTLSSRLGNAPETLSNTAVSGSRASVLPSDLNAAPTSASAVSAIVSTTSSSVASITVTRPSRPSSAPSLCVSGRGSLTGFNARNCVTNTFRPLRVMAMPCGLLPTFLIVRSTRLEYASMTDTVLDDWLATYSFLPSGVSAQPNGSAPTVIVSTTLRLSVLMTDTVPLAMFVTNALSSSGVMATHHGSLPTAISAIFRFTSNATLKTETESLSGLTLHTNRSSLVIAIGLDLVADRRRPAIVMVTVVVAIATVVVIPIVSARDLLRIRAPRVRRPFDDHTRTRDHSGPNSQNDASHGDRIQLTHSGTPSVPSLAIKVRSRC